MADRALREAFLTPDLRPVERLVLMALAYAWNEKTGEAWPSVATIGNQTGLSRRAIQDALKVLLDRWLIVREIGKSGRGNTPRYRLTFMEERAHEAHPLGQERAQAVLPLGTERAHVAPERVHVMPKKGAGGAPEQYKRTEIKNKRGRKRPAPSPAVEAFREEFKRYPNERQAEAINEAIRTDADLARWREVLREWSLNGWNPTGVAKMLDRFGGGGGARAPAGRRPSSRAIEQDFSWGESEEKDAAACSTN